MHVTHIEWYDNWLSLTLHVNPSDSVEWYFLVCDRSQLLPSFWCKLVYWVFVIVCESRWAGTCCCNAVNHDWCAWCHVIADTCCVSCSSLSYSFFSSFIVATIMPTSETMWIVCGAFIAAISADDLGVKGSASCVLCWGG